MNKKSVKKRIVRQPKLDVESMIETRFDRLEDKLDGFKDEINAWKQEFVKQLTKLNTNMENVMEKIAQHEFRFTEHDKRIKTLEDNSIESKGKEKGKSEMVAIGWLAVKAALIAGALIGSVGGCGWVLKILGIC